MTPDRGTALVTGAGRGIGAAIARELLGAGFKVAMASIEETSAAAEKLQRRQALRLLPVRRRGYC